MTHSHTGHTFYQKNYKLCKISKYYLETRIYKVFYFFLIKFSQDNNKISEDKTYHIIRLENINTFLTYNKFSQNLLEIQHFFIASKSTKLATHLNILLFILHNNTMLSSNNHNSNHVEEHHMLNNSNNPQHSSSSRSV